MVLLPSLLHTMAQLLPVPSPRHRVRTPLPYTSASLLAQSDARDYCAHMAVLTVVLLFMALWPHGSCLVVDARVLSIASMRVAPRSCRPRPAKTRSS